MIQNGAINSDNFKNDNIKFPEEFITYFQDFNEEFLPTVNIFYLLLFEFFLSLGFTSEKR